jgi:hypothetical protein
VKREIKDPEAAAKDAAESLGALGVILADMGLNPAAGRIAESLGALGMALTDMGLEAAAREALKSLETVGRATVETGDKDLGFVAKDAAMFVA